MPADHERRLRPRQEDARGLLDRLDIAGRQHQRELVAADPADGIPRAADRLEEFGDLHQQRVARHVTISVVDRLEIVEVDAKHCHLGVAIVEHVDGQIEPLAQPRAVRQPGESIVGGQAKRGLACLHLGGDVDADADETVVGVGRNAAADIADPPHLAVIADNAKLHLIGFAARDDAADRQAHAGVILVMDMSQEIVDRLDLDAQHIAWLSESRHLGRTHVAFPHIHSRRLQREPQTQIVRAFK